MLLSERRRLGTGTSRRGLLAQEGLQVENVNCSKTCFDKCKGERFAAADEDHGEFSVMFVSSGNGFVSSQFPL